MVGVVSRLTGYPPELLDVDLDLEADLGVDTVKQAEIFAAIREHFGVARDDTVNLRDFPTLTHAIGWIRDKTGIPTPAPPRHRKRRPAPNTGGGPCTCRGARTRRSGPSAGGGGTGR